MKEYWIKPKDKFYVELSKAFRGAVDEYIKEYTRITPIAYTAFMPKVDL